MRVLDNVGNASDLSNIVIGTTTQGTIVFEDDVEGGEGEWEIVGEDALWHISEHRANSPTHSWYYGDEATNKYDTGEHTQRHARFAAHRVDDQRGRAAAVLRVERSGEQPGL